MAQVDTLAHAATAVVPAGAAFFLAYGRYDGTFRDNVVFLYFIGGLIMGGFLGFLTLLSMAFLPGAPSIVLLSLLFPIAVTVGINRRKWQGERHAVFNGGAFGLGVATMWAFSLLVRVYPDATWGTFGPAVAVAVGATGLFFGLGLLAGNSVRVRKPLRYAFLGTAIVLAPVVFLGAFMFAKGLWTFSIPIALYGVIVGVLAERKLLIEGVTEEARKQRRRLRRKRAAT